MKINATVLNIFILLSLLFATGLLIGMAMHDEREPAVPIAHQGPNRLPVLQATDIRDLDPEAFQLVRLKDGHDYWLYRQGYGEQGYAAITHSPECQKCN